MKISDVTGYSDLLRRPWDVFGTARVKQNDNKALDVTTPAEQWSYAVGFPIEHTGSPHGNICGFVTRLSLKVENGVVGVGCVSSDGSSYLVPEQIVEEGLPKEILISLPHPLAQCFIVVRNLSAEGEPSKVLITAAELIPQVSLDITEEIEGFLPVLLKDPKAAILEICETVNSRSDGNIDPVEIGKLTCSRTSVPIYHDSIWKTEVEKTVASATKDLIHALDQFEPSHIGDHNLPFSREFFKNYLYQNITRVCHLVSALRKKGLHDDSVLEVGAYFGSFAYPLQRLGYSVTVVDRYLDHKPAFDAHITLMRDEGVNVVETTRETEADDLKKLDRFDAVISMAVIEHIPPPPRHFMEMLHSHVGSGGLLALDTPNILRYENSRRLARGQSIHQDLKEVYYCSPPYEGHHREYSVEEMRWMLEQVGCHEIETKFFDYNFFQFKELTADHLRNLLALPIDPDLSDTILVLGRI